MSTKPARVITSPAPLVAVGILGALLAFAAPVALILLAGCSSPSKSPPATDAAMTPDASVPATELTTRAAAAICHALMKCCEPDLAEYFAPYRDNELLREFRSRLPPDASFADEAECRAVLAPMLDIVPLGDWARAADAGLVEYDAVAAGACLAALDAAACGEPARGALWDSTCFGFAAPSGGDEQRRFVRRTRRAGDTCRPVRDGIGAAFYGTCDPTQAFCCYADGEHTGCQYPFDAEGSARPGTCAATAAVGAACSVSPPLQLCATGASCDNDTLRCTAAGTAMLHAGDTCIDASYQLLGDCQDSYCDVLGSKRCEPLRADGQTCTSGDECASGRCASVCAPNTVCTNEPLPPTDAGVDAAPSDAAPSDATPSDAALPDAPPAATGETCGAARSLVTSSVTSPVTGYTSRVAGGFGTTDDYNPLMASNLPPHCAFAYDARGLDVVFSVTLAPGDRLKLRAELADGKQAGIYLLDTCPGGSWPDFDQSGACGSNEYAAGFCGPVGCDPAQLDILYPTMLNGQPTTSATFWVVVDQVAGSTSTGFTLDWKLVH